MVIDQPQTSQETSIENQILLDSGAQTKIKPLQKAFKKKFTRERQAYPVSKVPEVITDFLCDDIQSNLEIAKKYNLTYRQVNSIQSDYQDYINDMLLKSVTAAYNGLKKTAIRAVEKLKNLLSASSEKVQFEAASRILQFVFDKGSGFNDGKQIPQMVINVRGKDASVVIGGVQASHDKDLTVPDGTGCKQAGRVSIDVVEVDNNPNCSLAKPYNGAIGQISPSGDTSLAKSSVGRAVPDVAISVNAQGDTV